MADVVQSLRGMIRRTELSATAQQSKVSEDVLRNFLDGKSVPSIENIQKLLDHFGLILGAPLAQVSPAPAATDAPKKGRIRRVLTFLDQHGKWTITAIIGVIAFVGTWYATLLRKWDGERSAAIQLRTSIGKLNEILGRSSTTYCATCTPVVYSETSTGQSIESRMHFNAARTLEPHCGTFLTYADYSAFGFYAKTFLGPTQSEEYLNRALDCAISQGDELAPAEILGNLGILFFQNGNAIRGKAHFDTALQRLKKIPEGRRNKQFVAAIYIALALSEYEFGNEADGEVAFKEATASMTGHPDFLIWKSEKTHAANYVKRMRKIRDGKEPLDAGPDDRFSPQAPSADPNRTIPMDRDGARDRTYDWTDPPGFRSRPMTPDPLNRKTDEGTLSPDPLNRNPDGKPKEDKPKAETKDPYRAL